MNKVFCSVKDAVKCSLRDEIIWKAATIAFFSVLSLAPLLILLVTVGGLLGPDLQQKIVEKVKEAMGPQAGNIFGKLLLQAKAEKVAMTISAIAGLVTTIFGATIVLVNLQKCLNDIFGVKLKKGLVLNWLYKRFASLLMLVGIGVLLIISVIVGSIIDSLPLENRWIAQTINIIAVLLLFTLLFMIMFAVLPDVKITLSSTFVGGLITAILFLAGQYGISKYISIKGVSSVFGAAGSLALLLIWIYYTGIVVLFGAELTHAYLFCFGKKLRPNIMAEWKEKNGLHNMNQSENPK